MHNGLGLEEKDGGGAKQKKRKKGSPAQETDKEKEKKEKEKEKRTKTGRACDACVRPPSPPQSICSYTDVDRRLTKTVEDKEDPVRYPLAGRFSRARRTLRTLQAVWSRMYLLSTNHRDEVQETASDRLVVLACRT